MDRVRAFQRARLANATGGGKVSQLSIGEVEELFVRKFQDKYSLTARDIAKAFKRFDKDGSGNLDLQELAGAIKLFCNGVDMSLVLQLVQHYDVDGDGQISLEEFTSFLLSRNSLDKKDWITVDNIISTRKKVSDRPTSSSSSSSSSQADENASTMSEISVVSCYPAAVSERSVEYKAKMFLQQVRGNLLKRSADIRSNGTVSLPQRLTQHSSSLIESFARKTLSQSFQPYMQAKGSTKVDFPSFCRVMSRYTQPGCPPPTEEILRFIFNWCDSLEKASSSASTTNSSSSTPKIDPDYLIDVIFHKEQDVINQFGFRQHVPAATSVGRPDTAKGPIRYKPTDMPITTADIPYRYSIKQSKTALAVPSDFDVSEIPKSASLPPYEAVRQHVYGINTFGLHSGDNIHVIPSSSDAIGNVSNNSDVNLLYVSGAVGVIHNTRTNKQTFFDDHTDDITCVAVSNCGNFAATGQLGRSPSVRVWSTSTSSPSSSSSSSTLPLIIRVGQGFLSKGVCAVCFSYDSKYIIAVSCDEKHSLGIWDIATGTLQADGPGANGVPPQILSLSYCNIPHTTAYINADSVGNCDVFASCGVRMLKFWSFKRATPTSQAQLVSRLSRMGKVKADPPKQYTCSVWVETDLVTGGDNGYLYRWRECVCISASLLSKGGVMAIRKGSTGTLFVGCAGGVVAEVDDSTFSVVRTFSVLPRVEPAIETVFQIGRPDAASSSRGGGSSTKAARGGGRGSGSSSSQRPAATKSSFTIGDVKEEVLPDGVKGSASVVGLALLFEGGKGREQEGRVSGVVCTTGFGRVILINTITASASSAARRPASASASASSSSASSAVSAYAPCGDGVTLLYYHYGPVWALAVDKFTILSPAGSESVFITGGDDKWLSLWGSVSKKLHTRVRTKVPIRCCDISSVVGSADGGKGGLLATGGMVGALVIYYCQVGKPTSNAGVFQRSSASPTYKLMELCGRKDATEDLSDIKFSPNGKMIAAGGHSGCIDIYSLQFTPPSGERATAVAVSCQMKYLRRLRGHSSYITHLDWSVDNRLIQSTCGAYELLYWEVAKGTQLNSSHDSVEADTKWHSLTTPLGFGVMGIWPPCSDGTDVNSVDVCRRLGLVATGDDSCKVNLFYYPCVVHHAPRREYSGHSSHVLNVKFLHENASSSSSSDTKLISVGGNDCGVAMWSIVRALKKV